MRLRAAPQSYLDTARLLALLLPTLCVLIVIVAPCWAQPRVEPGKTLALRQISIGFVRYGFGAWTARIADGALDGATGRSLRWQPFDTDSAAIAALAGDQLDVAVIGTGVLAAAFARGLDARAFYVLGSASDAEGLVTKAPGQFRFAEPRTLQGKVIATSYGSAAHLRLLESLRLWGLAVPAIRIVNLQSAQIAEAWQQSQIDAAAVSEPLLGQLGRQGNIVPLPATSRRTGTLVLGGLAPFVAQNLVFLSRLVEALSRADAAMAAASGPLIETREEVRSIARLTGFSDAEVLAGIARYKAPSLEAQAGPGWLTAGPQSELLAELRANAETWLWAGRLSAPVADMTAILAPEAVTLALTYRR